MTRFKLDSLEDCHHDWHLISAKDSFATVDIKIECVACHIEAEGQIYKDAV